MRSPLPDTIIHGILPTFSRLGLSQDEILTGQLAHTDLVWQVPPIICDMRLGKLTLQDYMRAPLHVNEEAFYYFWLEAMAMLRNKPSSVITKKGYKGLLVALREWRGDKSLFLSRPEGFPSATIDYAGAILSLECAYIMQLGGWAAEVHESNDDYWVKTASGYEVGVRGGFPIVEREQWDISAKGFVPDLLRLPRGDVFIGCDYDLVSKLRSVLHLHREAVRDFDAVDWALQALRVLSGGRNLPLLSRGIAGLRGAILGNKARLACYQEATTIMGLPGYSDRQKLTLLKSMLVPSHLTKAQFSQQIYSYGTQIPVVLTEKTVHKIQVNLEHLYNLEREMYAE
jgi:hypothetical protein